MKIKDFQDLAVRNIKTKAEAEILNLHPYWKQANEYRAALVDLIQQIPAEQRTEAQIQLLNSDTEINQIRERSNELEAQAKKSKSEQELTTIESKF